MSISTFSFPTTIRFGVGARNEVAGHLAARGVTRPLVVTDKGLAALAIHDDLMEGLRSGRLHPGSFSDLWGNPVSSHVTAGVNAYRDHRADGIVGFGGGAALDVAKAIALMATHPGELFEYENALPGARPIEDVLPWLVAIPTTAGTGSEVGRSAVIADDDTHVKKIIFSPHLLARVVFADPGVTTGLPPNLTAATGLDALTHNVEAYIARGYHPLCDGIAVEGLRLCADHLPRAVAEGDDLDARGGMLMASMMGAIAFQKGLGVVHSCAHALGTAADLHHGLANGLMVDHALAFNESVAGDRLAHLALAAGLEDASAAGFVNWLRHLKSDLGVAATLTEHGLDRSLVPELTRLAVEDACHLNNPRPVTADDFAEIFDRAFA